jgi:hypothetical protein
MIKLISKNIRHGKKYRSHRSAIDLEQTEVIAVGEKIRDSVKRLFSGSLGHSSG